MTSAAGATGDGDGALRRFERDTVAACVAMAAAAWPIAGFSPAAPAGVLGGGLIVAVSYRAIKGGVQAIVGRASAAHAAGSGATGSQGLMMAGFIGRYALLAVLAYVMLIHLHLHPVALLAGASAPVVAAALQLPRLARAAARRDSD